MEREKYNWDIFLAHAGADVLAAEELYNLLEPHCKVFLDKHCLLLGDDWDLELALAQRKSLVTVVLVSPRTEQAYYLRDEIAAAINMARKGKDKHRVVPVFLGAGTDEIEDTYGLRLKHGLYLSRENGFEGVAQRLLDLLRRLRLKDKGQGVRQPSINQTREPQPGLINNHEILQDNIPPDFDSRYQVDQLHRKLEELITIISDLKNDRDVDLADKQLSEWKKRTNPILNYLINKGHIHSKRDLYDINLTPDPDQKTPYNKTHNEARKCQKFIKDLLEHLGK
jgi:TIR domain